ncbi:flagella basal body P-ring formation protein FlgA [Agarivorans sp. 3_MG-2023]|uniref:flagella basal body P-ring formation protein FlgA n=1 Tax=Agarivorans sp. 3_MG-2023 TaxID=3062648 RepID=UPI0026E32613|nr:flagella basal body P-ring formation protein FlgA [Agarivorans sp. 3_MG-2023]
MVFNSNASTVALSFKRPELSIEDSARLSDVLHVRSSDNSLRNKINNIPTPKWKESVTSDEVLNLVKTVLVDAVSVNWRGEKQAKINIIQILEPEVIQSIMSDKTEQWVLNKFGKEAFFKWFPGNQAVLVNDVSAKTYFNLDERNSNFSVVVGDLIFDSGEQQLSVRVRYGLSVYVPILMATCPIPKGRALSEECLIRKYKKARFVNDNYFYAEDGKLQGVFALNDIMRGEFINYDLVKEPSLIEAGDRVIATYMKNGVKIDSIAIAANAGNAGHKITVSIESLGINLPATVSLKGRVLIDEH